MKDPEAEKPPIWRGAWNTSSLAVFHVVMDVRLHLRGQGQQHGARAVLERMLLPPTQQSCSNVILTVVQGYGRDVFVYYLRRNCISSIFVILDHLARPCIPTCIASKTRSL